MSEVTLCYTISRRRRHRVGDAHELTSSLLLLEGVRTGSWMAPPQGQRAPRGGGMSIGILAWTIASPTLRLESTT